MAKPKPFLHFQRVPRQFDESVPGVVEQAAREAQRRERLLRIEAFATATGLKGVALSGQLVDELLVSMAGLYGGEWSVQAAGAGQR